MSRIVFLDDNRERQEQMTDMLPHIMLVDNAIEAIETIKTLPVIDVLFLDHDLGGEVYVDSGREDTGAEVARWIAENKPNIKSIIIHTYNSVGAENMLYILKDYAVDYLPFANNKFKQVVQALRDSDDGKD
jgi:CheY-like chemotaxis protein